MVVEAPLRSFNGICKDIQFDGKFHGISFRYRLRRRKSKKTQYKDPYFVGSIIRPVSKFEKRRRLNSVVAGLNLVGSMKFSSVYDL